MDLSIYIGWITSLKEEFLSLMQILLRLGHESLDSHYLGADSYWPSSPIIG